MSMDDLERRALLGDRQAQDECVVQFHPPKSEYVNLHPYCLHLWKKIGGTFETPPKIFV